MDLDELAEDLGQSVPDVGHGAGNTSRQHFVTDALPRSGDTSGIRLNVHAAVQRVHPALERRELALRVRGDERHVGRVIGEIANPSRHHIDTGPKRGLMSIVTGYDLGPVAKGANDQGLS